MKTGLLFLIVLLGLSLTLSSCKSEMLFEKVDRMRKENEVLREQIDHMRKKDESLREQIDTIKKRTGSDLRDPRSKTP